MNRIDIIKLIAFSIAIIILFSIYLISRKNKKYIKTLGYVGIVYSIFYILWRVIYTLPPINNFGFIFGLILIIFEIIAFGQAVVSKMLFSTSKKIRLNRDSKFRELPTVDVLISTYNEPKEVLKRTIIGCKDIDYPEEKIKIYIGDDGRREDIRELAEVYDINYITRSSNEHAKAGNINNMLSKSNGEFILLLDADMIPRENIINKMIHYFEDSKTGFVQSPQVFYNLDPFQYNLDIGDSIPNEQDFFMRTIEEKRSLYNAVLHVGTNAVFRRSAVEEIGGIPTGSITEDMATGMLIQNGGYRSYFVKDTLAVGLSVESFEDLIKQRDRWCRGNIQVFKKYNPLKMKGLNFLQKVIYIDGFVYWMFGIQKMVYIISPLLFLLFRITIIQANVFDLALIFLPYFLSTSLYFKSVTDRSRNVTWSHIYDTAIAPQLASSFIFEFFFNKELKFNVTPKGTISNHDIFKLRLAITHIVLFVLSIIGIFTNIEIIIYGYGTIIFSAVLINIVWCIYNSLGIFISIFLFLEKRRYRKYERIPVDLLAKGSIINCDKCDECGYCGRIKDISENGAFLVLKEYCTYFDFSIDKNISIEIESIGNLTGTITRMEKRDEDYYVGIRFDNIGFKEFSMINKYRFHLNNKYIGNYQIDKDIDGFLEIIYKIMKKFRIR